MDYKSYFDIPSGLTYFNTPGNGLMPKTHHQWRRQRDAAFFEPSSDLRDQQVVFIEEVKEGLAAMFNCSEANIYCVPNFSFGYNALLGGLPSDTRFAVLEDDYPSLNYPIISRGFSYEIVKTGEGILEERILNLIRKGKVDVLLLSVVQYITGIKIDLEFIKTLKREFPDLIVIGDATQYLGTEPFDFLESGFDALGGSGYKWMMAGFGNGYMMLSDRLMELLYRDALTRPRPFETMWAHKSIVDTFFEPGHQDTLSHGTLLESIRFFSKIGLSHVKEHIDEVKGYAYEQFLARDWILPIVAERSCMSSLVNLQVSQDCYSVLGAAGVKCFPRGTGIRIGIHLYNDKADVDYLVKILDKNIAR